jgi:hypothetical protein
MSKAVDAYVTFRFIKILVTPWKESPAFKEGVIDNKGKLLVKVKNQSSVQKEAYTIFTRLVFNIKRILEKLPFGKSKISSYAAALFLIREETGMSEDDILTVLDELGYDVDIELNEEVSIQSSGEFILNENVYEGSKGSVVILENIEPAGNFAGIPIYKTQENIYITQENII